MKEVYIRKLFKHDVTHEISVSREILVNFFDIDIDETPEVKRIFSRSGVSYNVIIRRSKDPRFGGDFKKMCGNYEEGDLLVIKDNEDGTYNLEIISKNYPSYPEIVSWIPEGTPTKPGRHEIIKISTDLPSEEGNEKKLSLQQIYYGAPGTGKSHAIDLLLAQFEKNDLDKEKSVPASVVPANNVFQNESHDLSANFGQPVPAPIIVPVKGYSQKNRPDDRKNHVDFQVPEVSKAAEISSNRYFSKTNIFRTTFHPDSDYASFVGTFKPHTDGNGKITYAFVPQVFLKAYITAVKNDGVPVFLVIEEINRGNCAQIFGDLFQLLDRNEDGESQYSIDPDQDIREFLAQNGVPSDKLCLPRNLYIWATMNTSDQSLFPIDSAFKRRWEWKYVPIKNADLNWKIDIAGTQIDWWQFLEKINAVIEKITQLEDKKLGYFFAKADETGTISAETFVSKVLFYLWEDVFKNYGFDDAIFADSENPAGTHFAFRSFFNDDGNVNIEAVTRFVKNVVPEEFENQNSVPASE